MTKALKKIYSEISHNYEFVNHLLTWGLDFLWRGKAAELAVEDGGDIWLDLCSGTGEMAVNLNNLSKSAPQMVAADFSQSMLREAAAKPETRDLTFVLTDAKALPFNDGTFDLVTVSFATRNLNVNRDILIQCFREIHRVLKPGGRFVNVETSQPLSRFVRWLFHLYVRIAIVPIGKAISSSRGYEFLAYTIIRFYDADELEKLLLQAGFEEVNAHRMMFGAAAIHKAVK